LCNFNKHPFTSTLLGPIFFSAPCSQTSIYIRPLIQRQRSPRNMSCGHRGVVEVLDRGGWSTPRPGAFCPPKRDLVHILWEAVCTLRRAWKSEVKRKSLSFTAFRIQNCQVRSESIQTTSFPSPTLVMTSILQTYQLVSFMIACTSMKCCQLLRYCIMICDIPCLKTSVLFS
jgi:hypothetical protein